MKSGVDWSSEEGTGKTLTTMRFGWRTRWLGWRDSIAEQYTNSHKVRDMVLKNRKWIDSQTCVTNKLKQAALVWSSKQTNMRADLWEGRHQTWYLLISFVLSGKSFCLVDVIFVWKLLLWRRFCSVVQDYACASWLHIRLRWRLKSLWRLKPSSRLLIRLETSLKRLNKCHLITVV